MSSATLPPPRAVQHILIWHQGALGDLLLAGPALRAVSRHYPQARITGVGHPQHWEVLSATLPLAAVWDSGATLWAQLFGESPLSPQLRARLAPLHMALVFGPRPQHQLLTRLRQAGIPAVHWVPSFPEDGRGAVAALQAQHLAVQGVDYEPEPLRLVLEGIQEGQAAELPGAGPWVALAPGSGHPTKNWPLSHYYEISRVLSWEHRLQVMWLAGPAEGTILPYLQALVAAQGHLVLAGLPLTRVAAILSRCRLYVGNDSGLTHLAAAAGASGVLALFGPTDPGVWAPLGGQVRILTGTCPQAPCAAVREITCPDPLCLRELTPESVLTAAAAMLSGQ